MRSKVVLGSVAILIVALLIWMGTVVRSTGRVTTTEAVTDPAAPTKVETDSESTSTSTSDSPRLTGQDFVDALRPLTPEMDEDSGFRFESPDGANWLPVTETNPEKLSETRSVGFQRNEQGAALAAIHILNRTENAQDLDSALATVDEQVTGAGTGQLQTRVQNRLDSENSQPVVVSDGPIGYDITFFNPLNAEIKYYLVVSPEIPEGGTSADSLVTRAVLTLEVVWDDEQWKLSPPVDDDTYNLQLSELDPQFPFGVTWL